MTTTSHKLSSSLTGKALVLSLSLMMVASVLFAAAPSAMAQQTNTGTATVTTPPANVTGGPPPSLLEPGVTPPANVTGGPTLPPTTEGEGAEPPATIDTLGQ
jgi:hypothetical protein